ncbi:unnamed protein product [Caenorhabditis sp. 36 PRJEB53466]|nr:unnamed protein product [Caenorhabditis sp. 36 PRJEB53466]
MLIKAIVLLAIINFSSTNPVFSVYERVSLNPSIEMRDNKLELIKRSIARLNQIAGFDTLGEMGLGKRSSGDSEQAGEKRSALNTFDSLGGMGLGKRSSVVSYQDSLSSFDTLAGMGFGRK